MDNYDVNRLRSDFPALDRKIYNRPLIYLDNTATSQTPRQVVESIENIYYNTKANVHRGVHTLSQEMTSLQEAGARKDTGMDKRFLDPRNHLHARHHGGNQSRCIVIWRHIFP